MKSQVKSLLASSLRGSGLLRVLQRTKHSRNEDGDAVVLMYHRVVEDLSKELAHTQAGMMVTRDSFDRQLDLLRREYQVIPLSTLVKKLASGEKPEPRTVAITFDDGWRDNYTLAYPLLQKHQLPATIFLTTDYIGSERTFWFHKIGLALATAQLSHYELKYAVSKQCEISGEEIPKEIEAAIAASRNSNALDSFLEALKSLHGATLEKIADTLWGRLPPGKQSSMQRWMLNWDEVNAMSGGNIEFGSHGRSHRMATGIDQQELEREFRESREVIAGRTRQEVRLLAYPNGNYNGAVIDVAKAAGYHGAVTTAFERTDPSMDRVFALRRIGIHEGMSVGGNGRFSEAAFSFGISGWKDKLRGNL